MEIQGIRIQCYDEGAGDAVVFLHGWGSSFSVFQIFLDRMAKKYRVCAPNLPGFGGSEEPPEDWGVDQYADFVVAYIQALGLEKVTLIGHSNGGRIIIKLAAREDLPFAIQRIVLTGAAGIKPEQTEEQKRRLRVYKTGGKILGSPPIKALFPGALEYWRRRHGSADYRDASPRMRGCLVKTVNEDLTPYLSRNRYSTLLIWGRNDTETPLRDGELMEQLIPDAGLVVLDNAGHYAFLDQSYAFGRVLDSFLGL